MESGVIVEGFDQVLGGKVERIRDFQFLADGGQSPVDQPGFFGGFQLLEVGINDFFFAIGSDLDVFEQPLPQDRVKLVLGIIHRRNGNGAFAHLIVGTLNGASQGGIGPHDAGKVLVALIPVLLQIRHHHGHVGGFLVVPDGPEKVGQGDGGQLGKPFALLLGALRRRMDKVECQLIKENEDFASLEHGSPLFLRGRGVGLESGSQLLPEIHPDIFIRGAARKSHHMIRSHQLRLLFKGLGFGQLGKPGQQPRHDHALSLPATHGFR